MHSFDVFFSYAREEQGDAVERVALALRELGIRVFLDRWYLTPGEPWPAVLERTLARCNAVAVFVGTGPLGPWQQRERDMALDRQGREPAFRVIPVLLARDDPALGFLSLNTWVDLSAGPEDLAGLTVLAAAIRGEAPHPDARACSEAARGEVSPYRGLRPFREEDEAFFFGRSGFAETLTKTLLRQPLVTVTGASGTGKSSVVRAGLIPRLRRGAGDFVWDVVTLVPGDRPLVALAGALVPRILPDAGAIDRLAEVSKLARHFAAGDIRLRDAAAHVLARQPGTERLLVFVDQWEELYTLCADAAQRHVFVEQLLEAAEIGVVRVVLTVRGDFMGRALEHRVLADAMQKGFVPIGPMTRAELASTIVDPAERLGLTFEPGLPETILDDLGDEPGSLPLLEFLLAELWKTRHGNRLTHAAYVRLGRVDGAIAQRAEQVFTEALNSEEQAAAHQVFIRLVRPGEGVEDTRQRTRLPDNDPVATATIRKLAVSRLLVTGRDAGTGEVTLEVAHEALIRRWDRLRSWVDADREFLRTRDRVTNLARLWLAEDRTADRLLPPGRALAEGEDLLARRGAEIDPEVRAFISASSDAVRRSYARRLRRLRASVAVFALLAATASGLGLYAYQQYGFAQAERRRITLALSNSIYSYYLGKDVSQLAKFVDGNNNFDQIALKTYGLDRDDHDLTLFVQTMALGFRLTEQGNKTAALETFQQAIAVSERLKARRPDDPLPHIGAMMAEATIGEAHIKSGDQAAVLRAAERALIAAESAFALDPANSLIQMFRGKMLQVVAQGQSDSGDKEGAATLYARAIEAQTEAVKRSPGLWGPKRDLSDLWQAVGDYRAEIPDKEGAIAAHQRAREIREQLLAEMPGKPDLKLKLAQSYYDLGRSHLPDIAKSLQHHEKALELRSEVATTRPNDDEARKAVAKSLRAVAMGNSIARDEQRAIALYEKLIAEHTIVGPVLPEPNAAREAAADVFTFASLKQSQSARTVAAMRNARDLLQRAVELTSDKEADPQRALQQAWVALALVRAERNADLDGARVAYRRGAAVAEGLQVARPNEPGHVEAGRAARLGEAGVLRALAAVRSASGDAAGGITALREALAICEWVAEADRGNASHQRELATSLNDLAWTLATVEPAALRKEDEALALARRAVELTGGRDASILDTLAVAYFATGSTDRAIATGERALARVPAGSGPELDRLRLELKANLDRFRAARSVRPQERMGQVLTERPRP